MAEKSKIIMPGEFLATEEEYAAGKNTMAVNGKIISTGMGTAEFDETTKEVRVNAKSVEEIQVGDVVIGQVNLVKESTAAIHLLSAESGRRITGITVASLPIRNVSNDYVAELKKVIKIGDIIRARVAEKTDMGIDLTTKGTGFGVWKAYCTNCRKEMQGNNGKLMCLNCGNVEERKWFENEDISTRPQREGGFERRGSFGGGRRDGGFRRGGFGHSRGGSFGGRDRGARGSFGGPRRGHSGGFGGGRSFGGRGGFGRDRGFGQRSSFGGHREGSFNSSSNGGEGM